ELILASLDAPWEIQKERLERDLAKETAKLAAQEAALTALEAVAEDPATAMGEAQALSVQILELKNNNAALEIELQKAHNAIAAINVLRGKADDDITDYKNIQGQIEI